MGITRRTFIAILGAATAMVKDAFGSFGKKGATPGTPLLGPPPQGEPHKSVCYVYNAGMDFDGVQRHTFGMHSTIPGGQVTRIEQCEDWTARCVDEYGLDDDIEPGKPVYSDVGRLGRFMGIRPRLIGYEPSKGELAQAAGLYRIEQVRVSPPPDKEWSFEKRFVIVHPAQEIAENLASIASDGQIVRLSFWDGKEVDLDWVNRLIAADTFQGRIAKVSESSLVHLRMALLITIGAHAKMLRTRLARNIATSPWQSAFERKACKLFGVDEDKAKAMRLPEQIPHCKTAEDLRDVLDARAKRIEQGIPSISIALPWIGGDGM